MSLSRRTTSTFRMMFSTTSQSGRVPLDCHREGIMAKEKLAVSRMVYDTANASQDQPILSADAHRLYKEGKIVSVALSSTTMGYMMPRSKRQLYRNELPYFSLEVLALIDKAK